MTNLEFIYKHTFPDYLFNAIDFQIKGIAELLEGLIPYSQRHFSRIDRLLRSTFLLDYTLTGMSVIEPDSDTRELKPKSLIHSDIKKADQVALEGNVDEEQTESKLKSASKKRKSNKPRESTSKKVKGSYNTKSGAISV